MRYSDYRKKWIKKDKKYKHILDHNEKLSKDIVALKYDPERDDFIGKYRDATQPNGFDFKHDMDPDFLNDILSPIFVNLVLQTPGEFCDIPLGDPRDQTMETGRKIFSQRSR